MFFSPVNVKVQTFEQSLPSGLGSFSRKSFSVLWFKAFMYSALLHTGLSQIWCQTLKFLLICCSALTLKKLDFSRSSAGASVCSVRGAVHPPGGAHPAQVPPPAGLWDRPRPCWEGPSRGGAEGVQDGRHAPPVRSRARVAGRKPGVCARESLNVERNAVGVGSGLRARPSSFGQRNHLKEPNEPANENRVYAAPEHTCRILNFSPMEQIHFASLRKYVSPFYHLQQL